MLVGGDVDIEYDDHMVLFFCEETMQHKLAQMWVGKCLVKRISKFHL